MSVIETGAAGRSRKPKLAELVVNQLRKRLAAGEYVRGAKLPTENALSAEFAVSRTVVREAIATLAADGVVEARQGAGVFVISNPNAALRSIGGDTGNRISDAINVLEVRMGIEIESAGLAAERRTSSQDAAIHEAYDEFDRLLALGMPTGRTDFAIHRAIAAATNNPFYIEVLDALGSRTIPCDVASPWGTESVLTHEYQTRLQAEHWRIISAISAEDAAGAREAMREHLSRSQERYRARLRDMRGRTLPNTRTQ
jgi:DNA-binding FadR family transcriptional regulator